MIPVRRLARSAADAQRAFARLRAAREPVPRGIRRGRARAPSTAAWELGVRYFDTAPHYGLGLSERRLGAALAARPRDDLRALHEGRPAARAASTPVDGLDDEGFVVPATHRRVWDFSRDGIRRSLEESLERLGLDRVDIVYLHDPDDHWREVARDRLPGARRAARGGRRRRHRRRHEPVGDARRPRAGHRRRRGDARRPLHAARAGRLDDLLPLCERARRRRRRRRRLQQRSARAAAPGRTTRSTTTATRRRQLVARARAIADVCERHGTTLPAAALAFPLAHPAVASVCIGARTAAQMQENARCSARRSPPTSGRAQGARARSNRCTGPGGAVTHRRRRGHGPWTLLLLTARTARPVAST